MSNDYPQDGRLSRQLGYPRSGGQSITGNGPQQRQRVYDYIAGRGGYGLRPTKYVGSV